MHMQTQIRKLVFSSWKTMLFVKTRDNAKNNSRNTGE